MKATVNSSESPNSKNILPDLERRHNDVLDQLDDLNRRVETALTEARKQFQPENLAVRFQPT
jgi:hypothetical protein